MWLYNPYIPSFHDELAHPWIWIGMPTLTTLSCQLWSTVVPMLEAQLFQYRICNDLTILTILTMYTALTKFTRKETFIVFFPVLSMCICILFGIIIYGHFRYLFGPFRSLSVLFCVYSYRNRTDGLKDSMADYYGYYKNFDIYCKSGS